jgi:WD40 repeat protein
MLETSLDAHQHAVPKVLFTPVGDYLLATGAEGALSIWNVPQWEETRRIILPGKGVLQMALSSDGTKVYVSMDNRIVGYTLADGNQILDIELAIKGVYGLGVSPNDTLLANAGADGKVRIWELQ